METFIQETMLEDTSICDQLIEYHKNNMEYKIAGKTTAGEGVHKVSTDVSIMSGNNNPIVHMYMSEVVKAIKIYGEIEINKDYKEADLNKILNNLYSTNFFEDIDLVFKNGELNIKLVENPIIENINPPILN